MLEKLVGKRKAEPHTAPGQGQLELVRASEVSTLQSIGR